MSDINQTRIFTYTIEQLYVKLAKRQKKLRRAIAKNNKEKIARYTAKIARTNEKIDNMEADTDKAESDRAESENDWEPKRDEEYYGFIHSNYTKDDLIEVLGDGLFHLYLDTLKHTKNKLSRKCLQDALDLWLSHDVNAADKIDHFFEEDDKYFDLILNHTMNLIRQKNLLIAKANSYKQIDKANI